MERMCHPYGDYNLCIEVDNTKSQDENVQVCANVLAKQKAGDSVEESTIVKSQIFCLPFVSIFFSSFIYYLSVHPFSPRGEKTNYFMSILKYKNEN